MEHFKKTKIGTDLGRIVRQHMDNVLRDMPKVYFVKDEHAHRYRVGRTDWPGDVFNLVEWKDFETFRKVYESLNMPLVDLTDDDDGSEWEKIRS
jgi:hypothetical protein